MNYPQEPGYKAEGTSAQAAKEITSKAATVRDRVLALLRRRSKSAACSEAARSKSATVLAARNFSVTRT